MPDSSSSVSSYQVLGSLEGIQQEQQVFLSKSLQGHTRASGQPGEHSSLDCLDYQQWVLAKLDSVELGSMVLPIRTSYFLEI